MDLTDQKWKTYERIPSVDWIYIAEILRNCCRLGDIGFESSIGRSLVVMKEFQCEFSFLREEFVATQKTLLDKFIKDIDWGLRFNTESRKSIDEYFAVAQEIFATDWSTASNEALSKGWEKLRHAKESSHLLGVINTFFLDADDQPFSHFLVSIIRSHLTVGDVDLDVPRFLSLLTTPLESSVVQKEEKALMELYRKYQGRVELVPPSDIDEMSLDYGWIYYGYIGPAKTPEGYLEQLKSFEAKGIDPASELERIHAEKVHLSREKEDAASVLGLSDYEKKLFAFASSLVEIKDYRKASHYYGSFVAEKVLTEIGTRLEIPLWADYG